jgi:hypothetical protein
MPAGRPPKLDQVVDTTDDGEPITAAEKVVQVTRELWAPWDIVAKTAGISRTTLWSWIRDGGLARGKLARGEKTTANERRYADFLNALEKAEGQAVAERLSIVRNAAGGGHTRTKTVEKRNGDGDLVERTVTTETAEPLWTAAAWLLERRRPADFGRRMEVTGAGGQPLIPKEDRIDALAAALEGYQRGVDDGAERERERSGSETKEAVDG